MADDRGNEPLTDPDDEENIVIDTTSTEPLREAIIEEPAESDSDREDQLSNVSGPEGTTRYGPVPT